MDEFYNKHYIRTDASGNIRDGWSDGPHNRREVTEDDILINDRGGYQFRLPVYEADGGRAGTVLTEENPPLYGDNFIPLYKWDGERALRRTEEEIEADRAALMAALEQAEAERVANATETVLLEIAAEHEERICLMEMGISTGEI